VKREGAPLRGFESRKALALLCYLAVQGHPVSRSHLADLLWGDKPEARGRGNLSRVLHNLLTLLPGCLRADRHNVQFRRSPTCWLDVDAFDELAAQGDADSLTAAVDLYRGDFMAGFYLDGCSEFETWLVTERERWHRRVAQVLETLIEHHICRGEYKRGLAFASRLLELDPWREEGHRQMMLLLARCGQRCAALAQYEICRRALAEELGVEPTQETTALYERIRAAGSAPTHNLPAQPTPLVGREEELAQIARLLADPACRLLTLVGPGGIGKTRVALQAAADKARDGAFLEGVTFVPLAPVSGAEFLVSTIADTFPFSFYGGGDPKAQLLNYLREKEMLLVLDSFEHLLDGVGLLAEILANAPGVKLLVTSRERLSVRGEWLFEIQGLRFPEDERTERIESYSAVQLFLQSARRVQSGFSLSEAEKPGVARICQLVEGMPLAIELATAWMRTLPCWGIAQEVERGLEFLATPLRDVPERHRSMQAVFDHSWRLLSAEEQAVFRKLSVFRGGFRRGAAQQVAGASLRVLSALVDKSFLRLSPSGRYEIHELLRQYGEEKLDAIPGEKERAHDLHCGYYADFLRHREGRLKVGKQKEVLEEIGEEIDNVRASWGWAIERGKVIEIGKCLEGLRLFYDVRCWFREGEEAFRRAAGGLEASPERSRRGTSGGIGESTEEEKRVLGQVLILQGNFCFRLGLYGKGRELIQKGLILLRRIGQDARREIAFSLYLLGLVDWYMGDYLEAKRSFNESVAISREIGDRFIMGYSLTLLALVTHSLGGYSEAKQLFQEALVICREMGERRIIASGLAGLGWVAQALGEYPEAKQLFQESLATCREINDQLGVAICVDHLGTVAYLMGEYTEAKQLHQESLEISKEISYRSGIALALSHLGDVTCALREYQASGQYFRDALTMAIEIETIPVALEGLVGLAVLFTANKPGDAECKQAAELLTLVLHHPASSQETKDRAACLLAELEAQLPPQAVASAQERGRTRTLEAVVAEILKRLV
jgi:predicted ATPase/DNA-binding SARP family transcriptional activator